MSTKLKEETELWVACLKFLSDLKHREMETMTSSRSSSYFNTLTNTLSLGQYNEGRDSGDIDKKKRSKSKSKGKSHKFSNIDAKAFVSVINASKIITIIRY